MRIGIDISQIVYEGSGVGTYVRSLVTAILTLDKKNEYILFASSLRKRDRIIKFFQSVQSENVTLKIYPIPPTILEFLWNSLHILPIEQFIGSVDVFWSSDWTQPPLRSARGITTIHDLTVFHYPESFYGTNIVEVQKRRLHWAKKECQFFLCDSEATKEDAMRILNIEKKVARTVYPGFSS